MSETTTDETQADTAVADTAATIAETLDARSDEAIVAARSADIHDDEAKRGEHVKVFVLEPGPKPTEENGFSHEANMAATRQYMMSNGLRPTGDVRHVSTKPHLGDERRGWDVKYAVPAVPAERFDFTEVHVITENEDPDGDGHASGVKDGDGEQAERVPTKSDNRATIDAYAEAHGIDVSGATTKAEAVALFPQPTA